MISKYKLRSHNEHRKNSILGAQKWMTIISSNTRQDIFKGEKIHIFCNAAFWHSHLEY